MAELKYSTMNKVRKKHRRLRALTRLWLSKISYQHTGKSVAYETYTS